MVDIEYRVEDLESKWQRIFFIGSVVLLLLLVPTTAFGYFAEKSIPGQPLYSMKRAIETGILALESLTPYGKSNYLLSLADTRVAETSTLVENAKVSGDFADTIGYSDSALAEMVTSVREAQVSIQKIPDPVKKQQAEQNLANAVQKYQNNLQKIVLVIHEPSTNFGGLQNSSTSTPTTTPSVLQNDTLTPSPTPGGTTDTTTNQDQLTQQIQQTQNDLQQIQNQLNLSPDVNLLPTPTLSPTPTPTPSLGPTEPPHKDRNKNSFQGEDH